MCETENKAQSVSFTGAFEKVCSIIMSSNEVKYTEVPLYSFSSFGSPLEFKLNHEGKEVEER